MKRLFFLWLTLIIAITIMACDKDEDDDTLKSKHFSMEINALGTVSTYSAPGMERYLFGYPVWISDDFLLYNKAKLYRGSLDSSNLQQLLPDSIDCFGYGISYSISQQKIWFCNSRGIWSCNFAGGDIIHVNPTPIHTMQLSNHGNFLMGFRIDRAETLCLVNLATGIMEEQNTDYSVSKAFYNEDLQKISYLAYGLRAVNASQVRVRSRDGSSDQKVIDFGNMGTSNFQASADGRYVAGMIGDSGPSSYPLYVHDLQTAQTSELGYVRSFLMFPQSNRMVLLPAEGKYFKVSSYDFATGQTTDLHSGYMNEFRFYYLEKMIMNTSGDKIRIYGWSETEPELGRIL